MSEEERLYEYGQMDHFRLYGRDVSERIASCGYDVKEYRVSDYLDDAAVAYLHLIKEDRIYMGVKK